MTPQTPRGLPARIYLPIFLVVAAVFVGVMAYFLSVAFGVTGSAFGKTANPSDAAQQQRQASQQQGSASNVQGGPPAPVMAQLRTLRERIAAHPNDDVAITQLADMELAANRFAQAIPLYQRALKINPNNVAAKTGLDEAREGLQAEQQQ